MGINLVSKEEYKAYAGITNPNSDTEINSILTRVSEFVKTYCKRTFLDYVNEAKVEIFSGGSGSLILTEGPVRLVNLVEYSSTYGLSYTELLEFVDWVEDDGYIVSINTNGFPSALRGYKVTYVAGYDTLPGDLQLAVFDLITYYRRNDGSVHSTKSPGTNSVQVEFISTTTLPAHIRRILDLYRMDFA